MEELSSGAIDALLPDDGLLSATDRAFLLASSELAARAPIQNLSKTVATTAAVSFPVESVPRPNNKLFFDILDQRRCRRHFGKMSRTAVDALLFHGARVRESFIGPDGTTVTRRPAPSAGAKHPFELVCLARGIDGLTDGAWHFDPYALRLSRLNSGLDEEPWDRFCKLTAFGLTGFDGRPPLIILQVAALERTLDRYVNGLSLVWRDAGALTATLCFVAESLGQATCPVGFSVALPNAGETGLQIQGAAWVMGALAVGGRVD